MTEMRTPMISNETVVVKSLDGQLHQMQLNETTIRFELETKNVSIEYQLTDLLAIRLDKIKLSANGQAQFESPHFARPHDICLTDLTTRKRRKRSIFATDANGFVSCGLLTEALDDSCNSRRTRAVTAQPSLNPQLYLYFVVKNRKTRIWRIRLVQIMFDSVDERIIWQIRIEQKLQALCRPKTLLVFINPFGGHKDAESIFLKMVLPMLTLGGVRCHIILTDHAKHAADFLRTMSTDIFHNLDGVLAVGGDGLFNQIVHSIIVRQQPNSANDISDTDSPFSSPTLILGAIPAGSTNSVVRSIIGNADPITAALHVAIGSRCFIDVCSVHRGRDLLNISVNMIAYGLIGDTLRDSEQFRYLGSLRYSWSGLRSMLRNRSYSGLVRFRLCDINDESSLKMNETQKCQLPECDDPCPICTNTLIPNDSAIYPFHWYNNFSHIICLPMTCVSPHSPLGLAPYSGIGDGSMDLVLLPRISRCRNMRIFMGMIRNGGKDLVSNSIVKVFRVSQFSFTAEAKRTRGNWNFDGELVAQPNTTLHFRLHPRLIRYFGSDSIDDDTSIKSRWCCFSTKYSDIISS